VADAVVHLQDVEKAFDTKRAVDGLSFSIERGSIYGLLGPNGAGKTTTIRMMMRIIYPDAGSIEILGRPLKQSQKDNIGYLPEERGVYRKMKVGDLLTFFGEVKSMSPKAARSAGMEWLERLELTDTATKKVEELSKGMQQKVQFIATIMHAPDLIILDEPFSGLDPVNAEVLKDIILEFHKKGHTIIFSTHMMEQVEKLCQEICLINNGRKVLEGSLADVKGSYGRNTVTIRFDGDGAFLAELPQVARVNPSGREMFLTLHDGADPDAILEAAMGRVRIQKFEVSEPSIHDIFVERVRSLPREAGPTGDAKGSQKRAAGQQ
jgi:ABC-2 type transport system ATP-binding protein